MSFLQKTNSYRLVNSFYEYLIKTLSIKIFKRKDNDRNSSDTFTKNSATSCIKKSQKQKWHSAPFLAASITVEAAIALPFIMFMILILLFPLRVMESERKLQNTMESTAKNLSLAEYVRETGKGHISIKNTDTAMSFITGLEKGSALTAVLAAVDNDRFDNVYFEDNTSVLLDDGESDPAMIYMNLSYKIKFPAEPFMMPEVRKNLVVNRRAWIGAKGGRGRSKYGDELDDDDDSGDEADRVVYLGKTSSEVYHEDPSCHYLSNTLSSADASQISSLRNLSGGKYHACPSCKPGKSGTVYYFESGTAYHSSENCKAITSYSRTAKLSELNGMRPCSYCGKHAHNDGN